MGWIRLPSTLTLTLTLAALMLASAAASAGAAGGSGATAAREAPAPLEFSFTKGDTREGSKVRIRVVGDSLHYSRTLYRAGRDAVHSDLRAPLDARRRIALRRIMDEMPRFRVFGSCFGKGMRFYMVDTPEGRFYRSLPERAGLCFPEEPGIWALFEDLETFMAPPETPPGDAGDVS
jgi:hypothetical protein